ncbi:uncharacterized protein MONOS_6064 [Monocercomonoides exilis]|uniref:uncharacterized protein n=1 Tax=Monocercomonoides exilis TaxID=2049356 RepID=UPI00355A7988|nr:hypothetical protein MONOS_6064 [Monocercomonoides exilis]|eukprot:MONOS_6064.1-p1 / transcript=MONOS_6064.1 / gene=MONOS_6064 / organism=Monocercomonoides_exilis_PA203 / gene_product=unspecified product / transcript_product=unspecified product / location=Mono_scaffold00186:19074-22024(+) / protein_length=495 / sequence_SO=supercontig / SO=protein_coding / is_pseudo=false
MTQLTQDGFSALASFIRSNTSLIYLDVSFNRGSVNSGLYLIGAMKENKTLREIIVDGNDFLPYIRDELVLFCQRNELMLKCDELEAEKNQIEQRKDKERAELQLICQRLHAENARLQAQLREEQQNKALLARKVEQLLGDSEAKRKHAMEMKELADSIPLFSQKLNEQERLLQEKSKSEAEKMNEISRLQAELNKLKREAQQLKSVLIEKERERENAANEAEKLGLRSVELEKALDALRKEKDDEDREKEQETKTLEAAVLALQQQLVKQKEDQSLAIEAREKLVEEIRARAEEEIDTYQREMERMRDEFQSKMLAREIQIREDDEAKASIITAKLQRIQEQRKRLEGEIQELQRQNSALDDELQQTIRRTKEEAESHLLTIDGLKDDVKNRDAKIELLEKERDNLKQNAQQLEIQLKKCRSELRKTKEEKAAGDVIAQKRQANWATEKDHLNQEIKELQDELKYKNAQEKQMMVDFERDIYDAVGKIFREQSR